MTINDRPRIRRIQELQVHRINWRSGAIDIGILLDLESIDCLKTAEIEPCVAISYGVGRSQIAESIRIAIDRRRLVPARGRRLGQYDRIEELYVLNRQLCKAAGAAQHDECP